MSVEGMGTGMGTSRRRADGPSKAAGTFAYAGDLHHPDQLWGATLRSAHASARLRRVDTGAARRLDGVRAVITGDDIGSLPGFGLIVADQPVLARRQVRYVGEPIAVVAAVDRVVAEEALRLIEVDYEVRVPLTDPERALREPPIHPDGNVLHRVRIRHGGDRRGPVAVEGTYEVGRQDQAFLAPEAGLAIPRPDGRIELHVATQWAHGDHRQLVACLGLEPDQLEVVVAGVGGAFGAREDLSLHAHACLLARATGRPVKVVYSRRESFLGHPHRHPAHLWYRHTADEDGRLVSVDARILLDGGAYASSSEAVLLNVATLATGPYEVPNAVIDGYVLRTNNPPSGAMRGFGAVQVCFAHEAQMDRLAAELGLSPLELRLRNALRPGDRLITGQRLEPPAPTATVLRRLDALALPPGEPPRDGVVRGVGIAAGYKNLLYSAGYPDESTAIVTLHRGQVRVTAAAAEVGQGFGTVVAQIVESVLGLRDVVLEAPTSSQPSAGSSSASRQTWLTGGAVTSACVELRHQLVRVAAARHGVDEAALELRRGSLRTRDGRLVASVEAVSDQPLQARGHCAAPPTTPAGADCRGDIHAAFAFVAHRAVVDVDVELGLVRVVQLATAQDVGTVINPLQVIGQIEGGTLQGVGLALREELVTRDGAVVNPDFATYLVPTAGESAPVLVALVEEAVPNTPLGAKGVGEPPTISSGAAVVAAVRAATGRPLSRVPIRCHDIAVFDEPMGDTSHRPVRTEEVMAAAVPLLTGGAAVSGGT